MEETRRGAPTHAAEGSRASRSVTGMLPAVQSASQYRTPPACTQGTTVGCTQGDWPAPSVAGTVCSTVASTTLRRAGTLPRCRTATLRRAGTLLSSMPDSHSAQSRYPSFLHAGQPLCAEQVTLRACRAATLRRGAPTMCMPDSHSAQRCTYNTCSMSDSYSAQRCHSFFSMPDRHSAQRCHSFSLACRTATLRRGFSLPP